MSRPFLRRIEHCWLSAAFQPQIHAEGEEAAE